MDPPLLEDSEMLGYMSGKNAGFAEEDELNESIEGNQCDGNMLPPKCGTREGASLEEAIQNLQVEGSLTMEGETKQSSEVEKDDLPSADISEDVEEEIVNTQGYCTSSSKIG